MLRHAHRSSAPRQRKGAQWRGPVRHQLVVRAEEGDKPSTSGTRIDISDPAGTVVYGGRLPSRRRMALGGLTAVGIAVGGNLGGITSAMLGLDGGVAAGRLRLDVLIPVKGFKRCVDYQNGYEFRYPATWLADQTLARRQAQRAEEERALDPPALRRARAQRRQVVEPTAAFGPPGSSGELNVSAIVAPIYEGFALDSLGSPSDAAQRFLDTTAAPPGSDKTAALMAADARRDAAGTLYYSFEFTIRSPKFSRHNIAVLVSRDNLLYTLNVQCPEEQWAQQGARLAATAASFQLLPPSGGAFPTSL